MTAWLLLNLAAGAAALAVGLARGPTTRSFPLGLATLAGYLALVHTLVLGAGLLGHLTIAGLGLPLIAPLAVAVWLARRASWRAGAQTTGSVTAADLFGRLAAVAALGAWAWPHLVGATRLWIWDDYTYHMVYPALWLQERAIAAPSPSHSFTMQAWYPLSASVVASWFMVPWAGSRGDALAWVSLTGPLYVGLVATAAAAVLARCGCRPGAWSLPLAWLVTSPRVGVMASSFSDADLALAATLLGSLALAVPRDARETRHALDTDAAYAAALSGLALGVKVSAAPLALVVLALLVLRARDLPGSPWRSAARIVLIAVAGWTAMAGYWYARNVVHTGNPVYPAAFLGWSGSTFPQTTLREYAQHYGLRRAIGDALVVYADWPPSHALLAALGLLGLAAWLAWRRRRLARGARYFAAAALAMAVVILALLPFAPYSAGNEMTFRSGFVHWDSMRYIALVPMLGWIAVGLVLDRLPPRWTAGVTALAVVVVLSTSSTDRLVSGPILVALALASALLARLPRAIARLTPGPAASVALLGLALAGLVVSRHAVKAAQTSAAMVDEPLYGAVVSVLDRQPPGTRVTAFGDQWTYPAFGARAHLYPVRLDRDGRPASTLIGDAFEPGDLTVDPRRFRANLERAGIDVVVIVRLPHPGRIKGWPTQDAALEATGDARLLHRDSATAVWRLGATPR